MTLYLPELIDLAQSLAGNGSAPITLIEGFIPYE